MLLTISGVGPKAALSLLLISRVNNLKYAIMTGDEKHLSRGVGIGKKTAARIILELKDKLKCDELFENDVSSKDAVADNENIMAVSEAVSALLALGYSEKETDAALANVNKDDTVENIVKNALRELMK